MNTEMRTMGATKDDEDGEKKQKVINSLKPAKGKILPRKVVSQY